MKKRFLILSILLTLVTFSTGVFAAGFFSDVPANHWARSAIDYMNTLGIMKGDENSNTFRPDENISRAETAVVMDRMEDHLKSYIQNYTNDRIKAAITAQQTVSEGPSYEFGKADLQDWTQVTNEKLGLTFRVPSYIQGCNEKEVILDEIPMAEGIQQKGRKIFVDCGDLNIHARTTVYKPYEDYYVPSPTVPEAYEIQDGCLYLPTEECLGYRLKTSNGDKVYFVVFQWDGGDYYVGTYAPIQGNEYYKAGRFTMKIKNNDSFEPSDQVLRNMVDKKVDEATLGYLQDFEQIVMQLY